ncbi:hypothetical protein [Levilinea saccharolytica]|uniref:DUF11 domain-containing protein n=1 Tax=Levilinea saccharolytica TaxID=229921 RepID=A0A0P6XZY6_9CHLR|nr:hypothetical protein [Levilinea saccharolytica]KPL78639.1 hypothetical protein ADN01_14575 [Levilinea saccharolytica]GAP16815.1 hypothetical protein LSAC_00672 [Levilinea saccharolytica]
MKRVWSVLLLLIFSLSFFLSPMPAQAQAETPPPPAPAADLPEGVFQDGEGLLFAQEESLTAQGQEPAAPQAAYGSATDKFGYKRSAVPMQWLDVKTNGTPLSIDTGYLFEDVSLAFDFPFYENLYDQLSVGGYGYLQFGEVYATSQGYLPALERPNSLIAPFWFPARYSDTEAGVYTMSGTWDRATPEVGLKYTAVEWHRVQDGYGNTFTYEAILFENGTILFQYADMLLNANSWYCGTAGIENISGEIGLNTLRFCSQQKSNTAWKITRPRLSARIHITKPYQGGLASAGGSLTYRVMSKNAGDLGPDTFDITASSKWPVTFFQNDGVTPLEDTDADGKVDTGSLEPNETFVFLAQVNVPAGLLPGKAVTSLVTLRSSLNRSKTAKTTLTTAVSNQFTLVFFGDENPRIYQAAPDQQNLYEAEFSSSLYQQADGSYIQTGDYWDCLDEDCEQDYQSIAYTHINHDGSELTPLTVLTDFGKDPNINVSLGQTAFLPDGRFGILFTKTEFSPDPDDDTYRRNIYLGIVNLTPGESLWTEINLTGDDELRQGAHLYSYLSLAATADDRFVAAWTRWERDFVANKYLSPAVWGASVAADGQVVTPAALLTPEPGSHYSSVVIPLQAGDVAIHWIGYHQAKPSWGYQVYASAWDTSLNPLVAPRKIAKADGYLNALQLPNGKILVAWYRTFGNWSTKFTARQQYTLLKPDTLARASGVRTLKKPFSEERYGSTTALTYDAAGDGVLIWRANSGDSFSDLFYTRISGRSGAVLTKTMPIAAGMDTYNVWNFDENNLTTNLVP